MEKSRRKKQNVIARSRSRPGNPTIGQKRVELRSEHMQEVYEALYYLDRKATINQIWKYLDAGTVEENKKTEEEARTIFEGKYPGYNWTKDDMKKWIRKKTKRTISEKTILRCMQKDPRILREGWYYYIDEKALFESRNLNPEYFGSDLFSALIHQSKWQRELHLRIYPNPKSYSESDHLEEIMSELVRRFGAIMMCVFIEAARPYHDACLNARDKDALIHYWAHNGVPLEEMFSLFSAVFGRANARSNEIDESRIIEIIKIFKKSYPDLFEDVNLSEFFPEPSGYGFKDKPHGHSWPQKYRGLIGDI